jgi:succinoglycan biosynthesis transport protein ExoP
MLKNAPARYTTQLTSPHAGHAGSGAGTPRLDFDELFAAIRRQSRVAGIAVGITFGLGLVFLATAVPKYTATATLLIDSRRNQDQLSASIADLKWPSTSV